MSKDCEKLEKVQWRAARWIGACWDPKMNRWSRPAQDICDKLSWPTLERRRQFLVCCQVYKLINNLDCIPFSRYLSFNRAFHTRSDTLTLFCSHSRINAFRYSFFVHCSFVWNNLPFDVANAPSLYSFRTRLKKFLLNLSCVNMP